MTPVRSPADSPDQKRPKLDPQEAAKPFYTFMRDVTPILYILFEHGLISGEERKQFLCKIIKPESDDVTQEEGEKWCAETLVAIGARIHEVSKGAFRTFQQLPTTLRFDLFCSCADQLKRRYDNLIERSLHTCAEANLDTHEMNAVNLEPLLPLETVLRTPSSSVRIAQIFQSLLIFFERR